MCPSASVYALVASEGHFLESAIGVIKQGESVFNPVNTIVFFILSIVTILIGLFTRPPEEEILVFRGNNTVERPKEMPSEGDVTFADKMNRSKVFMWLFGIAGAAYIIYSFVTKSIINSLDFNFVIFIFLILNTFLYNSPEKYVAAFQNSIKPATQVMMQFPFYGGIMGIMAGSGLTAILAVALIKIANVDTLPFFTYVSASVVNLFVPSQGGQWIVQGPIIVEAGKALNEEMPVLLNAFVYGDEATNLIQPLYVIPALALVNMKLKEVWGFMAFIWLIWFIVTSIGLLFIPRFF
jgi:short-chain fatty acids transporter